MADQPRSERLINNDTVLAWVRNKLADGTFYGELRLHCAAGSIRKTTIGESIPTDKLLTSNGNGG